MENKTFEMKQKLTEVLGEALLILLNSKAHRLSFFVGDLEWLLLPALSKEQFRLFKDKDNIPMGLILWAHVNDEVQTRLTAGIGKLTVDEWTSGENLWIIDLIAPKGGADKMLQNLKESVFKGKTFKYQSVDKEGNRKIITDEGK